MQAVSFPTPVVGVDPEQHYLFIETTSRTELKVFLFLWVKPDGRVRNVMSFLFDKSVDSMMGRHLNNWRRPEGEFTIPQLVDNLWAGFWKHEEENQALGRLLWMGVSKLPHLEETEHTGARLLGSDKPKPKRKTKPKPQTPSVFDLFEE
jgi:hypothetical protein